MRPDGSEVWASVSITPVRDPDGAVDVLFGQMVDITERKAREASLQRQLEEIAGLGEIRRAFEEDRFELHAQPIIDLATRRDGAARAADPHARPGRRADPAGRVPAGRREVRRDPRHRPLGDRAGAPISPRAAIDVEINISAASIGDPGLIADIEHELDAHGRRPVAARLRDHRDRADRRDRGRGRARRAAAAPRLPLRPRRLRQRLRRLPLPQAPADGLPQDRSRVHPGRAARARRPARDPRDRRARARVRPADDRRGRRGRRRRWSCCVRSASTTPRASTSAGPRRWRPRRRLLEIRLEDATPRPRAPGGL